MRRLFDPVGDKDVRGTRAAVVAVGAERDALAVGREHREAVKRTVKRDLDRLHAVDVGHEDVERKSTCDVVGAEEDVLAIRVEVGGPIGAAQVCDLSLLAAIDLGHEELHGGGLDEALGEELSVGIGFFTLGRAAGAPHEVLTVGAEESTTVIAEFVGDLLDVAAIDVAGVQFQVTAAGAGEDHFVALGADRGFGVIAFATDEEGGCAAFGAHGVDVVGRIDGPYVFAIRTAPRGLGTSRIGGMGGGIQHGGVAWHEVGAGGAALTGADRSGWRLGWCSVRDVHDVDLVTFGTPSRVGGLEYQAFAVE